MGGKSSLADITPGLLAMACPHSAYQSKYKGKQTYKPTPIISTRVLSKLYSNCQCVHGHQQLMGANVTATGTHPLGMCEKVLGIVA